MSLSKSKSTEDSNSRKRILDSQDASERADLVKPLIDDANTGQLYHSKQYVACHKCVKIQVGQTDINSTLQAFFVSVNVL